MITEEKAKKKKRGKPPVIVPRKISEWIKMSSTNAKVNNWKVGGGHSYNAKNQ